MWLVTLRRVQKKFSSPRASGLSDYKNDLDFFSLKSDLGRPYNRMAQIYYLQQKKKISTLLMPAVATSLGMPLLPAPPRPRCPVTACGGMAGAAMVGEGRNKVEEGGVEVEQKRVTATARWRD